MRVGVIGSRRRRDRESITKLVSTLNGSDIVVSGGCEGPDKWAIEAADARRLSHVEHLPLLQEGMGYGERAEAYYCRNDLLVKDCDVVYAFVARDRKGGTENAIKWARLAGVRVIVMKEAQEGDETGDIDET